jgi:hypothetical protein
MDSMNPLNPAMNSLVLATLSASTSYRYCTFGCTVGSLARFFFVSIWTLCLPAGCPLWLLCYERASSLLMGVGSDGG